MRASAYGRALSATATKFADVATKDDCISFCQSESTAYGDNCRRSIVWKDDCGGDTFGPCGDFTGSDNCYCNYQVACGCTCYYCPVPDWMQDIDGPNAPYPVPDWNAVGPCGRCETSMPLQTLLFSDSTIKCVNLLFDANWQICLTANWRRG